MRLEEYELYEQLKELYSIDEKEALKLHLQLDAAFWVNYYKIGNEKGDPIEFNGHKPLLQIYNETFPVQVYIKGSQIGMTQTSINKILHAGNYRNLTAIYTMPTATDIYSFSQGRFSPILKNSEYLRGRMGTNTDNANLKRIGNSHIYFKGAQKDTQAISVPADVLIHDEYDFSNVDIIDAFVKRIGASNYQWRWYFSTPTIPGYGIDRLFEASDQHHWLVRCKRCNTWQKITFEESIMDIKGRYYYGCKKCKRHLDRSDGEWVAKFPKRTTPQTYDQFNRIKQPAGGARGYFVNPLSFTFRSAQQTMDAYHEAEKKKRGTAIKNFYNFDLGRAYVSGDTLITDKVIRKTMMPTYNHGGYNVLGCDQGDILHWVVKHICPDGRRPVVAYGKSESFSVIDMLMNEYKCRAGIVDALPNKHSARGVVQKYKKRLYMAYYKEQNAARKLQVDNKKPTKRKGQNSDLYSLSEKETDAILLDRTEVLDASAELWIQGRAYLVGDREDQSVETSDFIKQMTNMKRDEREDPETGIVKAIWVKTGDDHFRHADSYANIAAMLRTFGSEVWSGGELSGVDLMYDNESEGFDLSDLMAPVSF